MRHRLRRYLHADRLGVEAVHAALGSRQWGASCGDFRILRHSDHHGGIDRARHGELIAYEIGAAGSCRLGSSSRGAEAFGRRR